MSVIKISAGDFLKDAEGYFYPPKEWFVLPARKTTPIGFTNLWLETDYIPADNVEELEVASEESIKRIGGTLGWGAVGAVALGPVGLLAGLVLGGKGKKVGFVVKFKDGRKLLATTDAKTFHAIQAGAFGKENSPPSPIETKKKINEAVVLAVCAIFGLVAAIFLAIK